MNLKMQTTDVSKIAERLKVSLIKQKYIAVESSDERALHNAELDQRLTDYLEMKSKVAELQYENKMLQIRDAQCNDTAKKITQSYLLQTSYDNKKANAAIRHQQIMDRQLRINYCERLKNLAEKHEKFQKESGAEHRVIKIDRENDAIGNINANRSILLIEKRALTQHSSTTISRNKSLSHLDDIQPDPKYEQTLNEKRAQYKVAKENIKTLQMFE